MIEVSTQSIDAEFLKKYQRKVLMSKQHRYETLKVSMKTIDAQTKNIDIETKSIDIAQNRFFLKILLIYIFCLDHFEILTFSLKNLQFSKISIISSKKYSRTYQQVSKL